MNEFIGFVINYPGLAMTLLGVLLLLLMYLLRHGAHQAITRSAKHIHNQLRLAAKSCSLAAHRVRLRNHEVVNALARELMERRLHEMAEQMEHLQHMHKQWVIQQVDHLHLLDIMKGESKLSLSQEKGCQARSKGFPHDICHPNLLLDGRMNF